MLIFMASFGGFISMICLEQVLTQMTDSLSGGVERVSGVVADKNVTVYIQT
jgi:hypothetical protein